MLSESSVSDGMRKIFTLDGRRDPSEWWKSLGSPNYVCSPMVDQSELAFRLLVRELSAPRRVLCYTPMIHAAKFCEDKTYRHQRFATCSAERSFEGGLIAQFCGNDPDTLLTAAKYVEDEVDGVDLNLGCKYQISQKKCLCLIPSNTDAAYICC